MDIKSQMCGKGLVVARGVQSNRFGRGFAMHEDLRGRGGGMQQEQDRGLQVGAFLLVCTVMLGFRSAQRVGIMAADGRACTWTLEIGVGRVEVKLLRSGARCEVLHVSGPSASPRCVRALWPRCER